MAKKFVYRVKFKISGDPKTFRTVASSPSQASDKLRSKGGRVISVTKVGPAAAVARSRHHKY